MPGHRVVSSNKYLRNPATRSDMIRRSVESSSAVEGIRLSPGKETAMTATTKSRALRGLESALERYGDYLLEWARDDYDPNVIPRLEIGLAKGAELVEFLRSKQEFVRYSHRATAEELSDFAWMLRGYLA